MTIAEAVLTAFIVGLGLGGLAGLLTAGWRPPWMRAESPEPMPAPDLRPHAIRTEASYAKPERGVTRVTRGRMPPRRRGGWKSEES